ncbi:hypothetical protein A0H81_07441 [Grifola frondosa]|uniref:Uncharacterized protein n=1 Tax=Grifola frondosa TaxID=5627 RepID=A0A1C7M7A6_GRIFR|nr:hypothetical protein A0H81_07441 [Grifola frondosa]
MHTFLTLDSRHPYAYPRLEECYWPEALANATDAQQAFQVLDRASEGLRLVSESVCKVMKLDGFDDDIEGGRF